MEIVEFVIVFIFGTLWGSFLNVLIYRLPRGIDFVFKRSHCIYCEKTVMWYQNIPILSYLLLRGRCANCRKKISIRYPVVEILGGLIAVFLLPAQYSQTSILIYLFELNVAYLFVAHFFIDLDHRILPDSINLYLFILFLIYSLIYHDWKYFVLGGLIGLSFPLLVSWVFYKLKGEIGLGGGDIKLYAALGIMLGPIQIMQNIFMSCLLGALIGGGLIIVKRMDRKSPIPFGPFIILAACFQIFFPKMSQDFFYYLLH